MAYIDKKITYEFDKDVPKELLVKSSKPPKPLFPTTAEEFIQIQDWLNTIDPNWMDDAPSNKPKPDDSKIKKEGLESLMASSIPTATTKESFDAYYNILSRYYTPSELIGKSLFELDKMLQLHIKADGSLF